MLQSSSDSTGQTAPQVPAALNIAGEQWSLVGPITFDTVANLESVLDSTRATAASVSMRDTTHVDSSAVALLVAIKRRHPNVQFTDVPVPLTQLADLYGVRDLLL
jgi:ABC-type transporter Mla MlaB component